MADDPFHIYYFQAMHVVDFPPAPTTPFERVCLNLEVKLLQIPPHPRGMGAHSRLRALHGACAFLRLRTTGTEACFNSSVGDIDTFVAFTTVQDSL